MGDLIGAFPAPGQADFLQQWHPRRGAENFEKVSMKKNTFSWIRKEKARRGSLKESELTAKLSFDARSSQINLSNQT